jgi:hypothetical protein
VIGDVALEAAQAVDAVLKRSGVEIVQVPFLATGVVEHRSVDGRRAEVRLHHAIGATDSNGVAVSLRGVGTNFNIFRPEWIALGVDAIATRGPGVVDAATLTIGDVVLVQVVRRSRRDAHSFDERCRVLLAEFDDLVRTTAVCDIETSTASVSGLHCLRISAVVRHA